MMYIHGITSTEHMMVTVIVTLVGIVVGGFIGIGAAILWERYEDRHFARTGYLPGDCP